jgi:diaminopimelate decarboxylase
MDFFTYKNGTLMAEDVSIASIAQQVGTPFYCYSHATLTRHAQVFAEALAAVHPLLCFAVKANSNLAVLKTLGNAGMGADVVSQGELKRALAAGIDPKKIVFSGVGKTAEEMRFALQQKILQFNVESDRELLLLNDIAREMKAYAPIALRVNPDVDAKTHAKISTGKSENKFGIAIDMALPIFKLAETLSNIMVVGVSVHIGSQLTSLEPFRAAYLRVKELVAELKREGIPLRSIDLGGGLGVPYAQADAPPLPLEYGAMVSEIFAGSTAQLIFEPGRLIAGNAGLLVTKVLYVKRAARTYVIVDAGMNDLMRPALYGATHAMVPVKETDAAPVMVDVVGPVCESSDVFLKDALMPLPKESEYLALRTAGAYGASMSNSYNSRPLVAEVLVKGDRFSVIRARPSYEQMLAAESIPEWV